MAQKWGFLCLYYTIHYLFIFVKWEKNRVIATMTTIMIQEKWQQLIGRIKDDFKVSKHEQKDGAYEGESIEEIVFQGPAGEMRLVRTVKPRVLGEKTRYSNRIGSSTGIEKIYSDTETVDVVKLWRSQNGDWVEVDVRALG